MNTAGTEHLSLNEFSDWLNSGTDKSIVYANGELAASIDRAGKNGELRSLRELTWNAALAGQIFLTQKMTGEEIKNTNMKRPGTGEIIPGTAARHFDYIATRAA